MINSPASTPRPVSDGPTIEIRRAAPDGWDVVVEFDADNISVEHYHDWRHVEHRLSRLVIPAYEPVQTKVAVYIAAAVE